MSSSLGRRTRKELHRQKAPCTRRPTTSPLLTTYWQIRLVLSRKGAIAGITTAAREDIFQWDRDETNDSTVLPGVTMRASHACLSTPARVVISFRDPAQYSVSRAPRAVTPPAAHTMKHGAVFAVFVGDQPPWALSSLHATGRGKRSGTGRDSVVA